MEKITFALAVVMERTPIASRWQSHQWRLYAVMPDTFSATATGVTVPAANTAPRVLLDRDETRRVLYDGFETGLFNDEAEGYFLNVSSPNPCVFVSWRFNEDETEAVPHLVTLSYSEAARWMDAQEKVETCAMPAEIFHDVAAWVHANYTPPQKKQRQRPKSFESKEGRYDSSLDGHSKAHPRRT